MAKKRKHVEAPVEPKLEEAQEEEVIKEEVIEPSSPKTTQLGFKSDRPVFRNKERILVTCSRRIPYRYRHLMLNVVSLLPHCKKDGKVESKGSKAAMLNELVDLRNCSYCLFFESRKEEELYLWMARSPNGPSVKFLVHGMHTMEELKLTGNHLKGSRPILTFSSNFNNEPHWMLMKEMMSQIFEMPKNHKNVKAFHDHVFAFSIVDDHIWFRNYQISVPHKETDKVDGGKVYNGDLDQMALVEVGPRFCLNPIKIFGGSFGGQTLYENPFYVSPNQIRAPEKKKKSIKFSKRVTAKTRRKINEVEKMMKQMDAEEFADL